MKVFFNISPEEVPNEKKRRTLDKYIIDEKDRLRRTIRETVLELSKNECISLDAGDIIKNLNFNKYYWEKYAKNPNARFGYIFSGPLSRWSDHKAAAKKCIQILINKTKNEIKKDVDIKISEKLKNLKIKRNEIELLLKSQETKIQNLDKGIIKINRNIENKKNEKEEFQKKSQRDKERAKEYIKFFTNSFENYVKIKQNYINNDYMVFIKIIEIISIYQLTQKIKSNIKLR